MSAEETKAEPRACEDAEDHARPGSSGLVLWRRAVSVTSRVKVRYSAVWIVLAGLYMVGLVSDHQVVAAGQIVPIVTAAVPLMCLALGQTVLVIGRGFDLSVGGVVALVNVMAAGPLAAAIGGRSMIVLSLVLGLLIGLINGVGIVVAEVSPFIMTLGMGFVLTGVTLVYTGGAPSNTMPQAITALSSNTLGGVTWSIYIVAALAALTWFTLNRTRIGRAIFAQGLNPRAANLCGVNLAAVNIGSYAASGLFASIGGLLLAGYVGQGTLGAGQDLLLNSIAAVVVGGTTFEGGRGGIAGGIGGALLFGLLTSVLTGMGLGGGSISIVSGAVLLVAATLFRTRAGSG